MKTRLLFFASLGNVHLKRLNFRWVHLALAPKGRSTLGDDDELSKGCTGTRSRQRVGQSFAHPPHSEHTHRSQEPILSNPWRGRRAKGKGRTTGRSYCGRSGTKRGRESESLQASEIRQNLRRDEPAIALDQRDQSLAHGGGVTESGGHLPAFSWPEQTFPLPRKSQNLH